MKGEAWSEVLKHYGDRNFIPIALYSDEFSPNQVPGPHAKDTKLNAYYYSFPTLPDYLATSLENIFVAMIHNSRDLDLKEIAKHCTV